MPKKIFFLILGTLFYLTSFGQTTPWGFNIGSGTNDVGKVCKVAPNGNIYVAGKFTGTMDLDPGPGTHNITSNGQDDVFIACYSPAGAFQWGFGIGGSGYDGALGLATDASSNLYICGYIQTASVDFDPSAAGAYIGYAGGTGSTTSGDGFLAKYSASGSYLWAKDLGTSSVNDASLAVATDVAGCVYVSGIFAGAMSIYGGSLNYVTGQAYLIKYDGSGSLVWGHNFGALGNDCYPNSIQVSGNHLYVGGYYSGTDNFNTWGSGAYLTSTGNNDPFIAKYDTAGNFVFVHGIKGNGNDDQVRSVALDTFNNIYVTGYTNSPTLTFDTASASTTTVSAPGSGGNYDYFIAKYNDTGAYQWGTITGSSGDDYGYAAEISKGYLYSTGGFHGTVDFDPSTTTANLTSAGGADIFFAKYDLNGRYICSFRTGASGTDDIGYGIAHADSGYLYTTGQFGGSAVDFDPSAFFLPLTSVGGTDAYLVKHQWGNDSTFSGYLTGDTICVGQQAHLTLHITAGNPGPFTLVLNNGATNDTVTNVYPGTPFLITPRPTATTTYTVAGALPAGANLCTLPAPSVLGNTTVIVNSVSTNITDSLASCNSFLFTAAHGDTTYRWDFGDGDTSIAGNPVHTYTAAGTYTVHVTIIDSNRCVATDTAIFTILTPQPVNLGRDTFLCANSYHLQSSYSYPPTVHYLWSTGLTDSAISATSSGTYRLTVTNGYCSASDTVHVILKQQPVVTFGNDTTFCQGHFIALGSFIPTGSTYTWSNGSTGSSILVGTTGTYWLAISDSSCFASDTINVTVTPLPIVNVGPDITQCQGPPVILRSTVLYTVSATYLWNTGSGSSELIATAGGTYWLTVTVNGCSAADTINVTLKPKPVVNLGNDTFMCINSSFLLSSTQPAGALYTWSNGSNTSSITIDTPGVYSLSVNLDGCIDSDEIVVYRLNAPTVNLGQDTVICNGYVLHLLAGGDQASFLWSDGSGGKSFNISEPGSYWVTIANACDIATDTINVRYKFCDLWFPNAFTPNNDGKNDIIRVRGSLALFSEFTMFVFNRYGEQVFKSEDITLGWDGTYKGVPQDIGTYFYLINYTVDGKKESMKGDFQLIR